MSAPAPAPPPERPGTLESLRRAMMSWRTASVSLLSFSSGLPLGLVWIAIPDWLRDVGVDIRIVGLVTLAQAPWTFKLLWSPLMDRYHPPRMGRRRGWALVAQIGLFAATLGLAGVGHYPETPWVVVAFAFAIAFAAASQDIAIDAYAVDVLRPEEQGIAVGARTALYRVAMQVAGGWAITAAAAVSWPVVSIGLAFLYLPMMLVTWKAPEPPDVPHKPRTVKEAVWYPFLGFLARHRALEILAFVFFYKFADNLSQALQRPFFNDMGYSDLDRGFGLGTVGVFVSIGGVVIGGVATTAMGLGHSLWLFGFLQLFSNLGYVLLARSDFSRPLLYGAFSFETFTTALGTGAFSVLLLRMTQKRFSATQYALFSSLFGLPRIVAGPITGFAVHAMGWEAFFWATLLAGLPGLLMLQRFVPMGTREPHFTVKPPVSLEPLSTAALGARALAGGLAAFLIGVLVSASYTAVRALRAPGSGGFDFAGSLAAVFRPEDAAGWLTLLGLVVFAAIVALCTAAVSAARHGAARELHDEDPAS